MRLYVVILLQVLIWSIFSMVKWMSESDGLLSKGILLVIFSYFAFIIASRVGLTRRKSFGITMFTLFLFFSFERLFWALT